MHKANGERATYYSVGNFEIDNKDKYKLELSAGASDDFKAYNIYDMAGNLYEWTTEVCTDDTGTLYGVERGGAMEYPEEGVSIAFAPSPTTHFHFTVGFRVILYLK